MDIDGILAVYKPQGITPAQLIEKLRSQRPELKEIKIGFAGRLDPLAHGVMLLTVGEENKNRQQYLNLNKTYRFSVLFGIETDTYDYLGIVKQLKTFKIPINLKQEIQTFIKSNTGKLTQPYPPFSSKTLNGIPLFKLAKRKKLKPGDLPLREVEIFKFKLISVNKAETGVLRKQAMQNLRKIKGYFRQKRIIKQWDDFFKSNPNQKFVLADFEIECSSGTYVRGLAHKLGLELKCGAIAFEILRTKVGEYSIEDCIRI